MTWQANPLNKDIVTYRITVEYTQNGITTTQVFEVTGTTFEYYRRMMATGMDYTYSIQAIDVKNRIGPAATTTVR